MSTLADLIPDVEVLLAMAPVELAKILLNIIPNYIQNTIFLPSVVGFPAQVNEHWYERRYENSVEIALAEAWAWLSINMLVLQAPGVNGNNGYKVLSRTASNIIMDNNFDTYLEASLFPKELLHEKIRDIVMLRMAQGDFDGAVFAAFKEVEVSVRRAGVYDASDIGIALMRKAFNSDNGKLTNMNQVAGEREALSNLFAGAIGSYKNPHSHRTVCLSDIKETQEMLVLASHLLRIVDSKIQ